MSDSLIPSFLMSDVSESLRLLTKNERCEQIAQVAHQKWANHWVFWANRSFAIFFAKNEQFAQKTDERIPSPAWLACRSIFEFGFDFAESLWWASFFVVWYDPKIWWAKLIFFKFYLSTTEDKVTKILLVRWYLIYKKNIYNIQGPIHYNAMTRK